MEGWAWFYTFCQVLYLTGFFVMIYFLTRKVNWVDPKGVSKLKESDLPQIIMFYPVLKEPYDVMLSTLQDMLRIDYPKKKFRIVAIPNYNDLITIQHLEQIQKDLPKLGLEIMVTPPTSDPSWDIVWEGWKNNPKSYWWHQGKTKTNTKLPPKKTRQLIWAFYQICQSIGTNWVLDYVDADSVTPTNQFLLAAAGFKQRFDVLQSTNIAGNLDDTWIASCCAADHMQWDGRTYPHMSADGKHPFYVLGKGLYYRASDLLALGGFNPWIAIEDPEVGMRYWKNRKRLGIIRSPLVEEVPVTLKRAIIQRFRWVLGFWQSLNSPLDHMKFTWKEKFLARLNFVPTLFLVVNLIGLPSGFYALYLYFSGTGTSFLPPWIFGLSLLNSIAYILFLIPQYISMWEQTGIVLKSNTRRVSYVLAVNPIFLWIWWALWCIPLIMGTVGFFLDKGKAWERTEKIDANHVLVRNNDMMK